MSFIFCPKFFFTESRLVSPGGAVLWKSGSHSEGVDFKVPVITRMAVFNCASILLVWALQYSRFDKTKARAETRRVLALATC